MVSPIFWGCERESDLPRSHRPLDQVNPRPRWFHSLPTEHARSWLPLQIPGSPVPPCGPRSAAPATFSLICWPGSGGDELQLVCNRKTIHLCRLSEWPIHLTFSTEMNENVDNKTDNSRRTRKIQNREMCDLFLLLKRSISQNFLVLCFCFFTSVICDPFACAAKIFWRFSLWESSGWVRVEEPRVNKIPADAGAQGEGSPSLPGRGAPTSPPPGSLEKD